MSIGNFQWGIGQSDSLGRRRVRGYHWHGKHIVETFTFFSSCAPHWWFQSTCAAGALEVTSSTWFRSLDTYLHEYIQRTSASTSICYIADTNFMTCYFLLSEQFTHADHCNVCVSKEETLWYTEKISTNFDSLLILC